MPHFQNRDRVYFVTFVTDRRWRLPNDARDVVIAEIVREHERTAFVLVAVVMPDHVHLVMQPLWDSHGVGLALSHILRLIKGRSARGINRLLGRTGAVWRQESHDYQIRSDESLVRLCNYVAENPVRKGLCATPEEWPWVFWGWSGGRAEARPT
jgi:putative transposase